MSNRKKMPISVLLAGMLVLCSIGYSSVWSMFAKELVYAYHWTNAAASMPTTVYAAVYAMGGLICGFLQRKVLPRHIALVSGILMLSGLMLASSVITLPMVLIGYGVMAGLGLGSMYSCALSVPLCYAEGTGSAKISSLLVASYGIAPVFYTHVIRYSIAAGGISRGFRTLGLIAGCTGILMSFLLRRPTEQRSRGDIQDTGEQQTGKALTAQIGLIAVLCLWFFTQGFSSFSFSAYIANIAYEQAAVADAAALITTYACSNCLTRLISGFLDHKRLLRVLLPIAAVNILAVSFYRFYGLLLVACLIVGSVYGVLAVVVPACIRSLFPAEQFSSVYGIASLFAGLGASSGPLVSGMFADMYGTHLGSFIIAAILLMVSCMLTGRIFRAMKEVSL